MAVLSENINYAWLVKVYRGVVLQRVAELELVLEKFCCVIASQEDSITFECLRICSTHRGQVRKIVVNARRDKKKGKRVEKCSGGDDGEILQKRNEDGGAKKQISSFAKFMRIITESEWKTDTVDRF
ncbi:hypothetical protein NPIL_131621 [Nephila pilipes]|uniref:Uncharacterized protein n=1 Tax=Nephila pilipes TaxID=299642 RepID=A0A8X6QG22_NEPPI|nr:hypothetical protein NPIL_131621 [Nephila pilipes]